MWLLDWYQQFLAMRYEAQLRKAQLSVPQVCDSCETLRHQLEIANYEKKQLLERILEKPEPVKDPVRNETPMLVPRNVPWNVRRQMLEAEDRAKAKLMKDAPKPDNETEKKETEQFEKELKDATERREKQSS